MSISILQVRPQCTHGIGRDRCKVTTETDPLLWFNKSGEYRYCEKHGPLIPESWRSEK